MRDQIKAARITRVVIVSPDRLARNYVHQMVRLEEFAQAGCQVEFLERPMSEDPHDQLVLQIRGAVAEYERTLMAERRRRGISANIRRISPRYRSKLCRFSVKYGNLLSLS